MASFDLHVLGTPPAFILSQDQTLMFKFFLLGRSFFLLALFSAGALALPDFGSMNFGSGN